MHQDEHVSQEDTSVAVATVVAAVDQARSRGPPEATVSGEQVDHHSLLLSLLLLLILSLQSFIFFILSSLFTLVFLLILLCISSVC